MSQGAVLNHGRVDALPKTLFRPILFDIELPKPRYLLLFLAILLSLLAILYVKDLNRRLFIESQTLQHQKASIQNFRGKLILEESALTTPTRIQQVAHKDLNMVIPNANQIVLVKPGTMLALEK